MTLLVLKDRIDAPINLVCDLYCMNPSDWIQWGSMRTIYRGRD